MTVEPLSSTPEVTAKVVDGALRAIARFGLTKLTVDDVAREAGISRATLYRYFPGRGAVLAAVVQAETERLERGLDGGHHDGPPQVTERVFSLPRRPVRVKMATDDGQVPDQLFIAFHHPRSRSRASTAR